MPRGGARPGSGPAPNPNSARSKAAATRALKLGLVLASPPPAAAPPQAAAAEPKPAVVGAGREKPLDLMFRLMESGDLRVALQAAIAAAPYVHPKLMPVKVKVEEKDRKPNRFAVPPPPPRLIVNKQ